MVPLLLVLLALAFAVIPIWALFRILSFESRNTKLERRLAALEQELGALRDLQQPPARAMPAPPPPVAPVALLSSATQPLVPRSNGADDITPVRAELPVVPPQPPPGPAPQPLHAPSVERPPPPKPPPPRPRPRVNWEQFMGAKLFAWLGGFAAFLGAAFFIKYSFEHELIPPAVGVAIGYVFALALVVVGWRIRRRRYAITAQTLCATGVVCLYAVTFACSSIYNFEFFTPFRTFLLMGLITGGAFMLAVRLQAEVVAGLGMLGGFLTPVLLASGRDNPFGLFGYIALLDAGLIALALHQRWLSLVPLAAVGTIALEFAWATKFLNPAKATTAMVVSLVFSALFLAADVVARRLGRPSRHLRWPAIAFPCIAFLFAFSFLEFSTVAARPGLLFSFALAADACLLALTWLDEESPQAHLIGGFATFALLATWTALRLTDSLLPWALGFYLLHGVAHTAFSLLLERRRPGSGATGWSQLFPALALVLLIVPLFKLDSVTFALWPCVLLIDLLAIALAAASGSMAVVAAALILTLVATVLWLFRLPTAAVPELMFLGVAGGFAGLFFVGGLWLARRFDAPAGAERNPLGDPRAQLPAFAVLMPFFLLVMLTQRLPTASPWGVFGLAFVLVLLCLALTRAMSVPWLPACALAGVALLEYAWETLHAPRAFTQPVFAWELVFYAVFALFPFLHRARFAAHTGPWAVAALAGVVQFPLIYRFVQRTAPSDFMGVVPALFAVAPLVSFEAVRRQAAADPRARLNQLAWFGGVAVLFLTLIIPIQFERQWITLGWALEGVALLWLFRRVPHAGLRATGVVLLAAAFARLALNPAVLDYHARSGAPVFNWYLYTYGLVTLALFTGGRLLPAAADRALGLRVPPLLNTLGTVLAFLLLNIEIADFFSPPGTRVLTFQFSGHFARDMTYTIAWALFALALLLVNIWRHTRAGRYAALALLGVALLKLFLHDLQRLGALHRIGALFAVALIAIVASLAYQRFLPSGEATRDQR